MTNPFGNGETSQKITNILKRVFEKDESIDVVKAFYNIEVNR